MFKGSLEKTFLQTKYPTVNPPKNKKSPRVVKSQIPSQSSRYQASPPDIKPVFPYYMHYIP